MIIYNKLAATRILSPFNVDELFPIIGDDYPDVIEDFDETDGNIILRQQRFYNGDHELYKISKFEIVDPVVLDSVSGTLTIGTSSPVVVSGSGFGNEAADISVYLVYRSCRNFLEYEVKLEGILNVWYPDSLEVTFALLNDHVHARMISGPAKILVVDTRRQIAEEIAVTLI